MPPLRSAREKREQRTPYERSVRRLVASLQCDCSLFVNGTPPPLGTVSMRDVNSTNGRRDVGAYNDALKEFQRFINELVRCNASNGTVPSGTIDELNAMFTEICELYVLVSDIDVMYDRVIPHAVKELCHEYSAAMILIVSVKNDAPTDVHTTFCHLDAPLYFIMRIVLAIQTREIVVTNI